MTVQGRTEYDTLRRSVHNSQARQIVGALYGNPQFAPLGRGLPPLRNANNLSVNGIYPA